MKRAIGQDEIASIENDSHSLLNYRNLASLATPAQQITALKKDQRWQEDHHIEVSKRIDSLIRMIEEDTT